MGAPKSLQMVSATMKLKDACSLEERASLVAQMVKHLPAMWETQVQSLGSDTGVKTRLLPQIIIFTISPGVGDPLHLDSRPKLSRGF